MNSVAALLAWDNDYALLLKTLYSLEQCHEIIAVAGATPPTGTKPPEETVQLDVTGLWSKQAVLDGLKWFRETGAGHLLLITGPSAPVLNSGGLRRMVAALSDTGASIVYGDYFDTSPDGNMLLHPLIDHQPGSIGDTFDFGPLFMINGTFLNEIGQQIVKQAPDLRFGGVYDLRLRLSECAPVHHLPEPLYCTADYRGNDRGGYHFSYVDPKNREYQLEMEQIATSHLKRTDAFISTPHEPLVPGGDFPVEASVIIPVKNRVRTIGDAVMSALSQKTDFTYNVIVIDNHSNDGTTDLLAGIAEEDSRLVHLVPIRTDLLIGGCWNEAIYSDSCGRYAVQLDSDDIYDGTGVLARIIAEFGKKPYALVIGSYTTVNFDLKTLPPGRVDHREWSDENGPNNALRIAGLGAPRAYHVSTLRQFGFPNVSYGEDYAAVLRLSRSYPVGRIYDSVYWCRRWEENSDNRLPPETANRYALYKDRLRTIEIAARKAMFMEITEA